MVKEQNRSFSKKWGANSKKAISEIAEMVADVTNHSLSGLVHHTLMMKMCEVQIL